VLVCNNTKARKRFKTYLNICFSIKYLGPLKYFIGIAVARGLQGLFLCQRKYALEIINECGLLGAKPIDFPMIENHKLALASDCLPRDPSRSCRFIGILIHLTTTRLDLTYAVHILSHFM